MDKEQFLRNIQEEDNNSLRTGAANRILQLLQRQRYNNNEDSVKRWIWELCQNAKDVCNDSGKVKIRIDLDESNKRVIFRHNGRAFSLANVMSLINQSSLKDRDDETERTSGKFGTGFLTTHLLSEIVNISGILETEPENYSRFRISLDRTGHDKKEIIAALEKAVSQLQECQSMLVSDYDKYAYNTIFEYELDEDGIEVAQQGIENLRVSAPFVLSMLSDIEEITLEATGENYKYSRQYNCGLANSLVHEIIYVSSTETKKIYILNLTEENTTISIALEGGESGWYIMPYAKQQSRLFCDFPLIGTEDFPFPVLVCARDFNPTEPRDGIFLTCQSRSKIDDEIQQNRDIIERACELYKKLLEYVAEKRWNGIYNITKINSYGSKNWYDNEWLEDIVNNCNKYNFKSLIKQIEEYGNVVKLQEYMRGTDWHSWLSQFFNLIEENKSFQTYIASERINIIPNQNGIFSCTTNLYFDKDILNEYKEILKFLGIDCRDWLLDLEFRNRDWFQFEEYGNEQILKLIEDKLDDAEKELKSNVLFRMAYMYTGENDRLVIHRQICQFANAILKMDNQMIKVSVISERILQDALKHTITRVADRISECECIQKFAEYMEISFDEAVRLLAQFVEFVLGQGYDNLINKSTKPILPNQNGRFMIKDDIFLDNEMDETLKDLAVCAGYDIKSDLLMKNIYLELPESRWKNDIDVSQVIIKYVNQNRTSKEEEVRTYFKRLLVWICDNEEKARSILPNLCENKHYLYDDEEIARTIKQAETFNQLMEKYNISSPEKLEELIGKSQEQCTEVSDDRIELTEEVLLQLGIDSEDALEKAFSYPDFASKYIRNSKHDAGTYEYLQTILERSKNNILLHLNSKEEYDITEMRQIANTIFIIKKDGKEIFLLARPSDGGEVRIYYETEKDLLDYTMDWELWVEDGKSEPQKITFGKMIKLTGLNRIPLRGI